ncbi:MAG: hypothetical protein AB8H03_20530 [Saprospiraceae bacterium]
MVKRVRGVLLISVFPIISCKKEYPSNNKFINYEKIYTYDDLFKEKSVINVEQDEKVEFHNIDTIQSKEYLYKIEYFSEEGDQELIWGAISMLVKIGKTKLAGEYLWVPYELHGECWAENENVKMILEPRFKYIHEPENRIMTWMYLGSSVGGSNSNSKLTSDSNGSDLSLSGTIHVNAIHLNLISKEEGIEVVPHRKEKNIDTLILESNFPLLKKIFKTDKEIQRKQISIVKK